MVENGVGKEFLYYNGELLAESNPLGNVVSRYILGYGVSAGWNREKSGYHYYHLDEQNSTAYITGGSCEIENRYEYDAFGVLQNSREELPNRILYTGQQYDQTSGQYYLRARFYNPVIGRFVQEDVYRGDGLNLYAYCKNNPVVYYDPSGYKKGSNSGCPPASNNGGDGGAPEENESGSKSGSGSKFQEVFDLADNYTLSDDTFDNHILDRHGPNSTYGNKSHFNADFDIRNSIDSTLTGDNFIVGPNTAGREGYIFEQTFSNPIGTNSKGKPLYTLKVVIDEAGNVITAFPKK